MWRARTVATASPSLNLGAMAAQREENSAPIYRGEKEGNGKECQKGKQKREWVENKGP